MNVNDKRYIKNHKLIKDTFIHMLHDHNYDQITIYKLCNECLISKHTFYSHFENKDELMKQIMNDLFDGLISLYEKSLDKNDENMIVSLQNQTYDYINENLEVFYVLFCQDHIINFSRRIVNCMKNYILEGMNINIKTHTTEVLMIEYMLNGDGSILKNWVLNHEYIPLDEIKMIARKFLKDIHLQISDMRMNLSNELLEK